MAKKLLILAIIPLLIFVGAFLIVDSKVREIIAPNPLNTTAGILSAPFQLPSGTKIPAKTLQTVLRDRSIEQVNSPPKKPGQYFFDGEVFLIQTPPFISHLGELMESERVEYAPESGLVVNDTVPDRHTLVLAPTPIAPLGAGDIRMERHLRIEDLPSELIDAVVAIEDRRFYSHFGIDLFGISRAIVENVKAGRVVQGGSTLTQQLAKNLLFSPKKTLVRKFLEALAALSLELRLTKNEILSRYLNEVYLGQDGSIAIHGIGAAANHFFGKRAAELSLAESALLAGLIQAPSSYSPRRKPELALKRRNIVLGVMRSRDLINSEQHMKALQTPLRVRESQTSARQAPYFRSRLLQELAQSISLEAAVTRGVQVHTGIDNNLQQCATEALQTTLEYLEKNYPAIRSSSAKGKRLEGALLSIEPYSGLIKAWVGGRSFKESQFDHVFQAKRQIGSTVKPFVYLTALDRDRNEYRVATADTILPDKPITFDIPNQPAWIPENYDHRYRGEVTLRYAFENSLNLPAAYVVKRVGVDALHRTLEQFQVADKIPEVPAIALGAFETNLFQLTTAYGVLANSGVYVQPRLFYSATDDRGKVIVASPISESLIGDERPIHVVTNLMQGVVERGTAQIVRRLGYSGPAAGKTGTSNDGRDSWFVGFSPDLVSGAWLGYDDNSPTGLTGSSGAARLWANYLKCAATFRPPADFLLPEGITFTQIDIDSHKRATSSCPANRVVQEIYVRGTEPLEECPHGSGRYYDEKPDSSELDEQRGEEDDRAPTRRRKSFWELVFG